MTNEKRKITIGLDLGIASVGWSILDSTNKDDIQVLDLGVRLFEESKTKANDERRSHRSMRRRIRRLRLRKDELLKLFAHYNLVDGNTEKEKIAKIEKILSKGICDENRQQIYPLQIKLKGLKESLNNEELMIVLYSYLKHRGAFFITDEQLAKLKTIEQNNTYPSVRLYNDFLKEKRYIGLTNNINFKNEEFVYEIKELFKHQKNLSKEFQTAYLKLFTRKRDYATGPGSSISPTPYGMYYLVDGAIVKKPGNTLWEVNIGKCSVYQNEYRGLSASPICEFFNLLNNLSNIKVCDNQHDYDYLNFQQRQSFLEYFEQNLLLNQDLKTRNEFNKTELIKALNFVYKTNSKTKITIDNILGLKGTGKDKSEFSITKLTNLIACTKWLLSLNVLKKEEVNFYNKNYLQTINDFYNRLAKDGNDVLSRIQILQKFLVEHQVILTENELNEKSLILLKMLSGFNKSSSLSYKAMSEFIDYFLYNEQQKVENSSTYFAPQIRNSLLNNPDFQNKKYFPKNYFQNAILSKTAKRTFNQAINVINKIIHFYAKEYDIENIVIEMAREKNSEEVRKYLTALQRKNKDFKDELNDLVKEELRNDFDFDKLSSEKKIKLILWKEQNHLDIYDGQEIDLIHLVTNFDKYHIDHIIPYSICFVDSLNNKVLTKNENNLLKANQTPYYWLSKIGKFEEFENRVNEIYPKKTKKEKNSNLLYKNDISNKNNQLGFIATNLVDTRIATKLLLNSLQTFFETNKERYPNTKIKVINGSLTNYARYNLFVKDKKSLLPKDRNNYKHHAVDASIIGFMGIQPILSKSLIYLNQLENKGYDASYYDERTGEIIDTDYEKVLIINDKNRNFGINLRNIYEDNENLKVKFSKSLTTKKNMQLFDDTIYGIKKDKKGNLIKKDKLDLLNAKRKDLVNYFENGKNKEELLIYESDKKIYSLLNEIYKKYSKENENANPFVLYVKNLKENQYLNSRETAVTLYPNNDFKKALYIRFLKIKSNAEQCVQLKDKKTKNLINAIKTGSNFLEVRIFHDDNNQYVPINISSKFLKSNKTNNQLEIDFDLLNNELELLHISKKNKFLIINNGTLITPNKKLLMDKEPLVDKFGKSFLWIPKIKENTLFQFIGSFDPRNKKFEIKLIGIKNSILDEEGKEKTMRTKIKMSDINEYFDFCEVDSLGNIYNRKSLSDLLK